MEPFFQLQRLQMIWVLELSCVVWLSTRSTSAQSDFLDFDISKFDTTVTTMTSFLYAIENFLSVAAKPYGD